MRSLNAHLTAAGGHGHLPFHPECPVCRASRLAGPLPVEPIVPQRAQASLVAAVLALSAGGPAAGIAAADTPSGEGTIAPGAGDGAGQQGPGFDPGGEVPLPNEIPPPPAPVSGGDDDSPGGPVEGEPNEQLRAPATTAPVPTPPAPSGVAPSPTGSAPAAPAVQPPARVDAPPRTTDTPASKRKRRAATQGRSQQRPPDPTSTGDAKPQAAAVQSSAAASSAPVVSSAAAGAATRSVTRTEIPSGADSYVVRAGDSLWSIARGVVGGGASPAQVAREVHRLWVLNAERIGTGNPDLIMPGQELRLR